VECDGHDFHERTKEQAQRDKSRDRYLQANGWRVLRFTGSEIHRTPEKCADEIASIIQNDMIDDWRLAS
jgi:very-short-patch-repair endonuclease